jgi:hypothetical protein
MNLRNIPLQFSGLILLLAVILMSCTGQKKTGGKDKDLTFLISCMEGHFNSSAQAARDTNFFNITLHMKRVWPERTEAVWLYVEQAVTAKLDKPYRQRMYKVSHRAGGPFVSEVYTLPEESKYIGAWGSTAKLDSLSPGQLELRSGCAVILQKVGEKFTGSTDGKGCESSLRGAAYATSKVTLTTTMIQSWDQGFDTGGKQVWGATTGPYEFIRQN